jgi:hypothetical protein
LLEPEAEEPVELLDGVELVELEPELELEPDELFVPLPEVVPDVPDPEFVPDVVEPALVAALATSAPPVTSPLVNAPTASTLRKRSFMVCPFCSVLGASPHEGALTTVRPGPVGWSRGPWGRGTSSGVPCARQKGDGAYGMRTILPRVWRCASSA